MQLMGTVVKELSSSSSAMGLFFIFWFGYRKVHKIYSILKV